MRKPLEVPTGTGSRALTQRSAGLWLDSFLVVGHSDHSPPWTFWKLWHVRNKHLLPRLDQAASSFLGAAFLNNNESAYACNDVQLRQIPFKPLHHFTSICLRASDFYSNKIQLSWKVSYIGLQGNGCIWRLCCRLLENKHKPAPLLSKVCFQRTALNSSWGLVLTECIVLFQHLSKTTGK